MSETPINRLIGRLQSHGCNPRETGSGQWKSRCPAHKGKSPNLSIKQADDGAVILHCHHVDATGQTCSAEAIVRAVGLEMRDLFPDRPGSPSGKPKAAPSTSRNGNGKAWRSAEDAITWHAKTVQGRVSGLGPWIYNDPARFELMRVYRIDYQDPETGEPRKQFRPVYPDAAGWHVGDPFKGRLPLYHLDELAPAGLVYICEGEKCADVVRGLDLVATTSSHGAQSPGKTDWSPLAGKTVVILPDRDAAGEGYATAVAGLLAGLDPRPTIKVLRLPLEKEGDDVEQWLEQRPDSWGPEECRTELERLARAAPEWKPDTADVRPTERGAKILCAADIQEREIRWLWERRLAEGMLSMAAGDPKNGKSMVTLDVAARISRGSPFPGSQERREPGSVVILSAEDDPSRVICPRLRAAGADLGKIFILESMVLGNGREALPCLGQDLEAIEAATAGLGDCKLIIIDPVSAYLGGVDDHRNAELRGVLSPLKAMAERLGVAVLLVSHLSKGLGTNGKHRVIGSIAYLGACRTNSLLIRDRKDPTGRRILMCDNGNNLGPPAPTLGFVIEDRGNGPVVEWIEDEIDITAEQALVAEAEALEECRGVSGRKAAERFLTGLLAEGPVRYKEIRDAAIQSGVSIGSLRRAKDDLNIGAEKVGFGKSAAWQWRLPGASGEEK